MAVKLSIGNLNAWYGGFQALNDITMDVEERKVTAIMGPSGCGKSTLIRCINRLHELKPGAKVSGRISLGNVDVYRMDPVEVRRRIGTVFQRPNPFPTMSIFDNVAIGLKLRGLARSLIKYIVEDSLKKVYLWDEVKDKLKMPGTALSGGQQQRLCIARAIALKPEVLLMDEPTSALDPVSSMGIERLIRELSEEYTIVIVTHDVQQAARISDRVAFLYMGRLIEYGDTETLFERPRQELTERYLTGRFS